MFQILKRKVWNAKKFDENLLNFWMLSGAKACKSCRSRQELSNECLLAKFGFDTAENGPFKVYQKIGNSSKSNSSKHRCSGCPEFQRLESRWNCYPTFIVGSLSRWSGRHESNYCEDGTREGFFPGNSTAWTCRPCSIHVLEMQVRLEG